MEFLREFLGEELYRQVAEKLNGNDKVKLANLASGEYVSKSKFEAIDGKFKDLETQMKERDTQLETLRKSAGDNDTLKQQIKELQSQNESTQKEWQTKLSKQALDNALELGLRDNKAKSIKAVKALLELDKIALDGDKLIGFDEQLKVVKEQNTFLFNDPADNVPPGSGGVPVGGQGGQGEEFSFSFANVGNAQTNNNNK